jgi:hypothetical protein
VLTFMLAATTGAGVLQAREMARLRQQLVRTPDDATLTRLVSRRSRRAAALRAMIALLTLTLLGLVAS